MRTRTTYGLHPFLIVCVFTLSSVGLIRVSTLSSEPVKSGEIRGTISDAKTHKPVAWVNITLRGTPFGTMSDEDGRFGIEGFPVGTYSIIVARIGYRTLVTTDVVVSTGRPVHLDLALEETVLEGEGMNVVADYFHIDNDATSSTRSFNHEELRRLPGGIEDINRVMVSMPGVATQSDQINSLVVRGGVPIENLTLYDNIELPNASHFGQLGDTGGPIGMINIDLIREANFYAGGFPVKYGDKISSVLDIELREGDRESMASDVGISIFGIGGLFEGPLDEGRGSWMGSYRKSYLDLLKGSVSLTAVPHYQDLQGKIVYDLNPRNRLSFVGIGGIDDVHIEESENQFERNVDEIMVRTDQHAIGLNWYSFWAERGHSVVTLSRVYNNNLVEVKDDDGSTIFRTDSWEKETTLKGEVRYDTGTWGNLLAGAQVKILDFSHQTWSEDDALFSGEVDTIVIKPGFDVRARDKTCKVGLFLHTNQSLLTDRFILRGGLRFDYFTLTGATDLSPRLGLTYNITKRTFLNASYGIFSQTPPLNWITSSLPENLSLDNIRCDHLIFGIERLINDDLKFTVELYNKDYRDYPVELSDTTNVRANTGRGFSRGVDVFLQKKLFDRYHGLVSYSYSVARAETPLDGEYDWNYDFRHIFTSILGIRLSDTWEISGRWRYMGGRPYTPIVDSVEKSPGDWLPIYAENKNSARRPAYHRLDVRIDRRFHFRSWNLVLYVEVENVYNRKNLWGYVWNYEKNRTEKVYQFGRIPVGGLSFEF